jgi:hypothetical protein
MDPVKSKGQVVIREFRFALRIFAESQQGRAGRERYHPACKSVDDASQGPQIDSICIFRASRIDSRDIVQHFGCHI